MSQSFGVIAQPCLSTWTVRAPDSRRSPQTGLQQSWITLRHLSGDTSTPFLIPLMLSQEDRLWKHFWKIRVGSWNQVSCSDQWPKNPDPGMLNIDDPEVKKVAQVHVIQTQELEDSMDQWMNHYSSWTALKRAIGWLLKLKDLLKELKEKRKELRAVDGDSRSSRRPSKDTSDMWRLDWSRNRDFEVVAETRFQGRFGYAKKTSGSKEK